MCCGYSSVMHWSQERGHPAPASTSKCPPACLVTTAPLASSPPQRTCATHHERRSVSCCCGLRTAVCLPSNTPGTPRIRRRASPRLPSREPEAGVPGRPGLVRPFVWSQWSSRRPAARARDRLRRGATGTFDFAGANGLRLGGYRPSNSRTSVASWLSCSPASRVTETWADQAVGEETSLRSVAVRVTCPVRSGSASMTIWLSLYDQRRTSGRSGLTLNGLVMHRRLAANA
jgi:hypothetical protein